MLFLREGLSAIRHRLPRLRGFRAAGSQRSRSPGGGQGNDLLEDQVPRRPRKRFRFPDQNHAMVDALPALSPNQLKQGLV
jgi:hypothetical protein